MVIGSSTLHQPVADVYHRFDVRTGGEKATAETVNVDVKTLGIEGHPGRPSMLPEFFSRDDALRVECES
jgi:hypothetical protein